MSNSLPGVMFGKGNIALRIYDKWFETVKSESKRKFFTEKWQLEQITQTLEIDLEPEELSVIRVEFQLRREVLKEMQREINPFKELMINMYALWAYCRQIWIHQVIKVDQGVLGKGGDAKGKSFQANANSWQNSDKLAIAYCQNVSLL